MKNEDKNLIYLHELSDYKVADNYSDVRNWEVIDIDQRKIGTVDALLVNKEAKRVVYLDIEVDSNLIKAGHEVNQNTTNTEGHEFLNKEGENHILIPIGMVILDESNKKVHASQINYTTFTNTKRFAKGDNLDRSYENRILPHYSPTNQSHKENHTDKQFYESEEFYPPIRKDSDDL
jgi:sporulation protein YlmC with PRC-barrel domain